MRLTMRLVLTAAFAAAVFGALTAVTASAFHPLFLTQSKRELLVLGLGGLWIERAEKAGAVGEFACEKVLIHGWVSHDSPLIHRLLLTFHGKCGLSVPAINEHKKCTEPITTKLILGELGLASSTVHTVLILLIPASGTEFYKAECEGNKITVGGAIIGEIPEINAKGQNQYNKKIAETETVFAVESTKPQVQELQTIWLLGVQMGSNIKLTAAEFFGGNTSWEFAFTTHGAGGMEICTH